MGCCNSTEKSTRQQKKGKKSKSKHQQRLKASEGESSSTSRQTKKVLHKKLHTSKGTSQGNPLAISDAPDEDATVPPVAPPSTATPFHEGPLVALTSSEPAGEACATEGEKERGALDEASPRYSQSSKSSSSHRGSQDALDALRAVQSSGSLMSSGTRDGAPSRLGSLMSFDVPLVPARAQSITSTPSSSHMMNGGAMRKMHNNMAA